MMSAARQRRYLSPQQRGQRARLMGNWCVAGVPLMRITCSLSTLPRIAAEYAFPKGEFNGVMRQDLALKVCVWTLLRLCYFVDTRRLGRSGIQSTLRDDQQPWRGCAGAHRLGMRRCTNRRRSIVGRSRH